PTNHFAPVFQEILRYRCLAELKSALQRLLDEPCGGAVPDMIFDCGDVGKEPMIRVLGKDPDDVVNKVLKLANCL
ncbi:MAG: thiamine-phosphate synthase family protein, partial [Kiritimatiellia bacterium]|nr:thiamine-phosphate synthase family protein [Kiritimatiellia bacterium]